MEHKPSGAILDQAESIQAESIQAQFDSEALVEQVWRDLSKTAPRPLVAQTVTELLAKYEDAAITQFVPALVRREAIEFLRLAKLSENQQNNL